MIPLLAQTSAALPEPGSAASIGWLVLTLAGLALAANQLLGVRDRLRAKQAQPVDVVKQPLTVKPHEEYTPLAVHRAFAERVEERFEEQARASSAGREKIYNLIRDEMRAVRADAKQENTGIHNRITELVGAVRELKGRVASSE
jgi:hypothetical protein